MKKKLLSVFTALFMVFLILPLGVSANKGVEEYIPKLKEIFNIGDEYGEYDASLNTYGARESYDVYWMGAKDQISVELNSDGNIIGYSKYSSNYEEEYLKFPKISKEEALKKAEEIIEKVYPGLIEQTEYIETEMPGDLSGYYFNFVRKENDILYNYNSISVQIDNTRGEVNSLYIDWDEDIVLPSKENIMEEKEAYEIYRKGQDVELVYRFENKENKLVENLMYTIKDKNKAIDAKTGKDVENPNNIDDYIYYGLFGNEKNVSTEDKELLLDSKEIVSNDEAEKELREFADLDESYTIEASRLMKNEIGKYIWEIQIFRQEENQGYGTSVYVDAKTKEVITFDNFNMNEDEEIKYNEEEGLEKAHEFLKEKMPEKYKDVEYSGSMIYDYGVNIQEYVFAFNRILDGVKVPQNGFLLTISASTGEVVNYSHVWNDIVIPSKKEIIKKEKAEEILLNDLKLELNYIIDKNSIKNKKKEVTLVYNLSSEENIFLDAKTGKIISREDVFGFYDINEREKEYKDIDKSYAKEYIKKLKENGIYLPGKNYYPEKDIMQKDFLYLLSNTKGYIYSFEEEYIYESLQMEGVINVEEKAPDEAITRLEAAIYIVRSFGLERAANLKNVYKSNYDDIDSIAEELKGYVAVAEGLEIISGQGDFRGYENLTREEAAVLVYNILNR